jgi:hypothetical protein
VTAVNSVRTPSRRFDWTCGLGGGGTSREWRAVPGAGQLRLEMTTPPGLSPEAVSARSLNLLKVLGDVAEDLADDRAQEQKGHDHDNRDEG